MFPLKDVLLLKQKSRIMPFWSPFQYCAEGEFPLCTFAQLKYCASYAIRILRIPFIAMLKWQMFLLFLVPKFIQFSICVAYARQFNEKFTSSTTHHANISHCTLTLVHRQGTLAHVPDSLLSAISEEFRTFVSHCTNENCCPKREFVCQRWNAFANHYIAPKGRIKLSSELGP